VLLFLKSVGYNVKADVVAIPVSGQTGLGIKTRVPKSVCPWYNEGQSLLDYLDGMQALDRKINEPLMMVG
jgi:peptide chain release factor subunit 3